MGRWKENGQLFDSGVGSAREAVSSNEQKRDRHTPRSVKRESGKSSESTGELKCVDVRSLPSVLLEQRKTLPRCKAVYFIFDEEGLCLYVGRSADLLSRLTGHNKLKLFKKHPNAKVAWLECSDTNLLIELEGIFIETLNPLLNERSSGSQIKTFVHPVRFTKQEFEWLKKQAEQHSVSVGEVVRSLVKKQMEQDSREH